MSDASQDQDQDQVIVRIGRGIAGSETLVAERQKRAADQEKLLPRRASSGESAVLRLSSPSAVLVSVHLASWWLSPGSF
jgi:hypothetical protein